MEHPSVDGSLFPLSRKEAEALVLDLEGRIDELQTRLYAEGRRRLLVVLQAMDTGGKDGTIRKVFEKMDPQGLRVASFKKPSAAELSRDFLWRVHKEVPADGEVVIFNRSHYEDIVAVRVREIFPETVWRRRYRHIVEFERMLAEEGTTVLKIFLHISKDEQGKRLQARLDEPSKNWKFNEGDLEDRMLWPNFMEAYGEVFAETSTDHAPWYVVPADRKWYRNLVVADLVVKTLDGLGMSYPPVNFDPASVRIE
jgi:PPK2 family polyphosphate:nucleotide phosphotransferase